jgi:hypothetical protein
MTVREGESKNTSRIKGIDSPRQLQYLSYSLEGLCECLQRHSNLLRPFIGN